VNSEEQHIEPSLHHHIPTHSAYSIHHISSILMTILKIFIEVSYLGAAVEPLIAYIVRNYATLYLYYI